MFHDPPRAFGVLWSNVFASSGQDQCEVFHEFWQTGFGGDGGPFRFRRFTRHRGNAGDRAGGRAGWLADFRFAAGYEAPSDTRICYWMMAIPKGYRELTVA